MKSSSSLPAVASPASAVVMAASRAKTPLAVADVDATDARITFVNAAFAELLESSEAAWVGRPLSALAGQEGTRFAPGITSLFEVELSSGRRLPVALSIASVPGADGKPSCLLCSLVDARGEGADQAIALDAEMLAQVAGAAGDLMRSAAVAANASTDARGNADDLALEAVRRTVDPADGSV